ncbi:MAG: hypothetical protein K9H41_06865 [Bacteroidia bacterium]|nr:hypothetical protein [Bacteroidia bacterium]
MKRIILILTTFILYASLCKSQTSSNIIKGNYIGQSVTDLIVTTIEVKENNQYILKTYDSNRKFQKKFKGKWTFDGEKLMLTEKSGTTIVLEKDKDTWFIKDKNGTTCLARFYQNKDQDEFWSELMRQGC